ncbi:cellulose binding domain-containing protein [Catenuloplanes sp. NPDC051500]|uniref:cellulose binding domain-containing protein n=1 Tax=Catenuloplanes sp. NPDC051500 TaxID=3363959 RepID=UPI0037948344
MSAATTLRNLAPWLPTGVAVAFLLLSMVTVATYAVRGDVDPPVPVRAAPALPSFSPDTPPPSIDGRATIGLADPGRRAPEVERPSPGRSSTAPQPSPGRGSVAPQPARNGLSGAYRVLDSFDGGFIGEVLVSNAARTDADWTVTLTMPETITGLVTSWVEGAPQATLDVDGRTYTWRSGVPVGAGGSVPLRFHVNRDGGAERPARCTVNGTSCSGLT